MIIENLLKKEIIKKIIETEIPRYTNFFINSYKENLEHSKMVLKTFPRWSIISGYYAMHDITKLFLAKKFQIKIDVKVHKTAIRIIEEITNDKKLLELLKTGYEEFTKMAADLTEARDKRQKAQYYTGSQFMREKYKNEAEIFLNKTVIPYLNKIKLMIK